MRFFIQEPREGGFLKAFFAKMHASLGCGSECQMYCWANYPRVFCFIGRDTGLCKKKPHTQWAKRDILMSWDKKLPRDNFVSRQFLYRNDPHCKSQGYQKQSFSGALSGAFLPPFFPLILPRSFPFRPCPLSYPSSPLPLPLYPPF